MWLHAAILFGFASYVRAQDYTVESYPNPKSAFKECNMMAASNVCDPYETLTKSERYRINNELMKFSQKTEEGGNTFCTRKGTDVYFVIVQEGTAQFANELRQKWKMDTQCGRNGLLVLSLNDRHMYGSFDERSPIKNTEVDAIITSEESLLRTGSYTTAVANILKELSANQKQDEKPKPADNNPTRAAIGSFSNLHLVICLIILLKLF